MAYSPDPRFRCAPERGAFGSLLPGLKTQQLLVLFLLALLGAVFPARGVIARSPSGTWSSLGGLPEPSTGASAVLLPDGRVLIAGGEGSEGPLNAVTVFTTEGAFEPAAPMLLARSGHQAALLSTGKVLVTGGIGLAGITLDSAEIYDPAGDSWSLAGPMSSPRARFSASLLRDGRVLVAGGTNGDSVLHTIELFDPQVGSFSGSSTVLSSPRSAHTATVMGDGRVLIAGGSDGIAPLSSIDLYDPVADSMAPGPGLETGRAEHSATRLLDGSILLAGGTDGATELSSAEIVNALASSVSSVPGGLSVARRGHLALFLTHNGSVLIAGGSSSGSELASCELYLPARSEFTPTSSQPFSGAGGFASALAQEGIALAAGSGGTAVAGIYGFATLKTDKEDYAPEQTVTISGSGWEPGETVSFLLTEVPETHEDHVWSTTADESGSILDTSFAPEWHDQGVRFYLTATGSLSEAQATFTDGTPTRITTSSMSPNSGACASTITASATLEFKTGPANAPFAGLAGKTVSFTLGSSSASGVTGATGAATASLTVPPGATSLVASFAGDSTFNGVSSSISFSVTGSCDSTPPVITPSVTGTLGANGWYVSNVSVGWIVNDPGSSVTSTSGCGAGSVTSDTEAVTFTCTATSSGGTSSNAVTIKRDATPPTATLLVSSGTEGANGWYVSDVTVAASGSDPISGPVTCTDDQVLATDTPGISVQGACSNRAGLSTNASPLTIKLDKTAPTITVIAPNTGAYTLNATVASAYACADDTSGISTCTGPAPSGSNLNTSAVGSQTFSVTGTDLAGNHATLIRPFNVQYAALGTCLGSTGHTILEPINGDGSSVFKQKSTVPAKFRVCDANGASIGAPDVVSSFRLIQKSSGTVTEVDEAVVSTTPDTAFRWDPTAKQWIFNMATKSLPANTTFYYRVTLNDSTTIDFLFGLK